MSTWCDARTVLVVRVVTQSMHPEAVRCPALRIDGRICNKFLIGGRPGGHFTVACRCGAIVEMIERTG